MITQAMQKRLEMANLEPGEYTLLPSDAQGNGYDIAYKSRPNESGIYHTSNHICVLRCISKIGSHNWDHGISIGYRATVADPKQLRYIKAGRRIIIRWISKANGSWQRVHGQRGYYRAVLIDPHLGNDSGLAHARGTVKIISESFDCDSGTNTRPPQRYEEVLQAAISFALRSGEAMDISLAN